MNSIPLEAQPYAVVIALISSLFFAALVSLWLLRRKEAKLLKNRDALEKQILLQQRELMANRKESSEWRAEMKRQFDIFRAMASDQLGVEEKRFDDLLKNSQQKQLELQASLDMARQMCAELPAAKARVMQLEQALEIDAGEGLSPSVNGCSQKVEMAPLPVVEESVAEGGFSKAARPPAPTLIIPAADAGKVADLERKLSEALQRNNALQQALAAARLRARIKTPKAASSRSAKSYR